MRLPKGFKKLLGLLVFAGLVGLVFYAYERGSQKSASTDRQTDSPRSLTQEPNTLTPDGHQEAVKIDPVLFREMLKESFKELPRQKDIEALRRKDVRSGKRPDFEHARAELLEKARSLGTIVEAVTENAALEPDALVYFKKCADDGKIMLNVRARCLTHYKNIGAKPQHGINVDLNQYPPELARLVSAE